MKETKQMTVDVPDDVVRASKLAKLWEKEVIDSLLVEALQHEVIASFWADTCVLRAAQAPLVSEREAMEIMDQVRQDRGYLRDAGVHPFKLQNESDEQTATDDERKAAGIASETVTVEVPKELAEVIDFARLWNEGAIGAILSKALRRKCLDALESDREAIRAANLEDFLGEDFSDMVVCEIKAMRRENWMKEFVAGLTEIDITEKPVERQEQ